MENLEIILLVVIMVEVSLLLAKNRLKLIGKSKRMVLIDTSSLIDGRILSVATTGFIGDELVITRSVLNELQLLADGFDSEKRARARFGLDVISDLQKIDGLDVRILHDDSNVSEGVDSRLIWLAKKNGALILTNDYNLNKVAAVDGVAVLNINDLAQSVRSAYLPGDTLSLELVQKGSEVGQAVGYLPDGTMVVVEAASRDIGKMVEVEFIRYLQTSAGKMMFAREITKEVERTSRSSSYSRHDKKKRVVNSARNKYSGSSKMKHKETNEEAFVRMANDRKQ
jgi:Integral membrane protein (PIN domain superfamily)